MRVFLATLTVLSVCPLGHAQPAPKPPLALTPEHLLAADCLLYCRYDGYTRHRKAYDQTALAKAMKEGLGDFFDHAFVQLGTLANGFPVRKLNKGQRPAAAVDGLLDGLWEHGFALSLEIVPPRRGRQEADDSFQLTVVFPEGAAKKNRLALENLFRTIAGVTGSPIEEVNLPGRKGLSFALGEYQAVCWPEGKHLFFTLGVEPVRRSLRVIDGGRANLTTAPWYAELATFKRYETDMRGYIDLKAAVDWLGIVGMDEPSLQNLKDRFARDMLLRHLGLTGLKNLTFHLGFDGKYQRSTVRLGVVEPRRRGGLLRLISGPVAFAPDKLPPLPPNADYVSVRHLYWNNVYDYVRRTYGMLALARFFEEGNWPGGFPDLDQMLEIDFRKDFLDQLDTTLISYGAHSEGPFFLGQGFAIKVKDAVKVRRSLAAITKVLGEIDDKLVAHKQTFRGRDLHVFRDLFLPVTFTLHEDWLVFGLFPQPVQGFILRSGGQYRVWKAPPEVDEVLAKERKEIGEGKLRAASVSDPRPAVEMGLALLPVAIQALNQTAGTQFLDVSKVPNAQAVNEWLFPNVMLSYDDGHALRWENYYSLNEPDDLLLFLFSPVAAEFLDARRLSFALGAGRREEMKGLPQPKQLLPPPEQLPAPKKDPAPRK